MEQNSTPATIIYSTVHSQRDACMPNEICYVKALLHQAPASHVEVVRHHGPSDHLKEVRNFKSVIVKANYPWPIHGLCVGGVNSCRSLNKFAFHLISVHFNWSVGHVTLNRAKVRSSHVFLGVNQRNFGASFIIVRQRESLLRLH